MVERLVEALSYPPIQRAVVASCLCGVSCSLLSVFVVLLRLPLIGVAMSHAALTGAVLGMLLGLDPFACGFALCLLTAASIGPLADRADLAPENTLGILFSFLIGIAFLGMGVLARSKAEALNLIWGSILTVSRAELLILAVVTAALLLFVLLLFKEIQAVLFNRRLAAASGVPERAVYYLLLILTGAVVSANLATVGGLLIFALIVQPGATAYQLTYDLRRFFVVAAASGTGACLLGLLVSYVLDWPSGASIVLVATTIFTAAFILSPKRLARGKRAGGRAGSGKVEGGTANGSRIA